jgi:hypothetical protein
MAAIGLSRQGRAGLYGATVDMHHTGPALTGVAADMGSGQVEMIAQEMNKQRAVFTIDRNRLAVHCQFDCRHVEPPVYFELV